MVTGDLAAYVARLVDEMPPLTDEQRDRIAALVRTSVGGDRDAA